MGLPKPAEMTGTSLLENNFTAEKIKNNSRVL
jgi:hypothetical protein